MNASAATAQSTHVPVAGAERKPTVLIVDDDEQTITLFTAILEQAGYPILRAGSAMAALNQSAGTKFDIALIDRNLRGGVGGAELLSALKGARPDLVAIMVTGDTTQAAAVEAPLHRLDRVRGDRVEQLGLREALDQGEAQGVRTGGVLAGTAAGGEQGGEGDQDARSRTSGLLETAGAHAGAGGRGG